MYIHKVQQKKKKKCTYIKKSTQYQYAPYHESWYKLLFFFWLRIV